MALYTSTKNGVVQGMELGVFVLPHRWTFATLKACVHDFLANQFDRRKKDIKIDRIYYKKSGKSRTVVAVNGDMDISALLDEYPLTFACRRRKTGPRAKIIMAVDWSLAKRHGGMCAADRCLFMLILCIISQYRFLSFTMDLDSNLSPVTITPRRFPRLALTRSTSTATYVPVTALMDVFVFKVMNTKQNEPKISQSSILLQDVNEECTLSVLKEQLRAFDRSQNLFVPASGLFWLRKGSKQMVQLKTEKDLAFCKDEYRDKVKGRVNSVRVACAAVSVENLGKLAFAVLIRLYYA